MKTSNAIAREAVATLWAGLEYQSAPSPLTTLEDARRFWRPTSAIVTTWARRKLERSLGPDYQVTYPDGEAGRYYSTEAYSLATGDRILDPRQTHREPLVIRGYPSMCLGVICRVYGLYGVDIFIPRTKGRTFEELKAEIEAFVVWIKALPSLGLGVTK